MTHNKLSILALVAGCGIGLAGCIVEETDSAVPVRVFLANKEAPTTSELYATFSDTTIVKLSDPLGPGGNVVSMSVSPDRGHVAYVADANIDGDYELFIVAIGKSPQPVKVSAALNAGDYIHYPVMRWDEDVLAWSPDGRRLAYLRQYGTGENALMAVDADGSNRTRLNRPLIAGGLIQASTPKWSPDGMSVSYIARQDNDYMELYVSSADGVTNTRVSNVATTLGSVNERTVYWSPDGSRISYVADQDLPGQPQLYVGSASTAGTRVSHTGGSVDGIPTWSKDSSRLAFTGSNVAGLPVEVFVVAPDGTGLARVSAATMAGAAYDVKWSPDGSKLAYAADQAIAGEIDLYTVNRDGSGMTRVSGTLSNGGTGVMLGIMGDVFAWSPGSASLFYISREDNSSIGDLYITGADGTGKQKVVAPVSSMRAIAYPSWSPGSDQVAFMIGNSASMGAADNYIMIANTSDPATPVLISSTAASISDNYLVPAWSNVTDEYWYTYVGEDDNFGQPELFTSNTRYKDKLSGPIVGGGGVTGFQ